MNDSIFCKFKSYIEKYHMIAPEETVVTGVSGGADSVCLLFLLLRLSKELPFHILVVHINHGIRSEGVKDAAYVEKLCTELELPFFLVEEDVRGFAAKACVSEEEAGRIVRYRAFHRVLSERGQGKGKIAVGHNANDRAETMLFHLFRGTGLAGISGIHPVRDNVIRPLLCLEREDIEAYMKKNGIAYCMDATNSEDTYTRNRIRHHILAYAQKEICVKAVRNMWETADRLLETADYIEEQAAAAYAQCLIPGREGTVISADKLLQLDHFMQKQVILHCLNRVSRQRKDILAVHVENIHALLSKTGTKKVMLPNGLIVIKEYDSLIFAKGVQQQRQDISQIFKLPVPGRIEIPGYGEVESSLFSFEKNQVIPQKSYTKWFDYDKISKIPVFRTRNIGDYLTISPNMSKKTLKRYMIDEKISKYERDKLYLLADGNHVIWVPGYRISQSYKITEDTKHILQVCLIGGD